MAMLKVKWGNTTLSIFLAFVAMHPSSVIAP